MGILEVTILLVVLWVIILAFTAVLLPAAVIMLFGITRMRREIASPQLDFRQFIKQRLTPRRIFKIGTRLTLVVMLVLASAILVRPWVDTFYLRKAIRSSSKLVLRTGGNCHRTPKYEKVIFETTDPGQMLDFSRRITIGLTVLPMHCMCCGDMTCNLYRGTSLFYSFSVHHGIHIRILGDDTGDRRLSVASINALDQWLKQTGVETKLADAKTQSQKELFSDLERSSKSK